MNKNVFLIVVVSILLIGIVSADIYSEDNLYGQSVTNITHITIYENDTDYWDGLDTPADINTGDLTDDNTYLQVAGDTGTGNFIFNQDLTADTYNGLSIISGDDWIYLSGDGSIESGFDIAIPRYGNRDFYYGYGGIESHYFGETGNELIIDSNGDLTTTGDLEVGGIIINDAIYCESSDLNDQTFAVAGVRYRINITNVDEGNGITMSTGNNGTNITIETSGVYHLVAQPQVKAGAGSAGDFHMWIEKDSGSGFVDVSDSNIELKLSSLEEDVIVLATTSKLNQGDVLRLVASVSNDGILLHAQSPAGEPVIPSIIFTMYRVGS